MYSTYEIVMYHFNQEDNIIVTLIKVVCAEVKFVAYIFVFS